MGMNEGMFVGDETYFTILTPLAPGISESVVILMTVCQR